MSYGCKFFKNALLLYIFRGSILMEKEFFLITKAHNQRSKNNEARISPFDVAYALL